MQGSVSSISSSSSRLWLWLCAMPSSSESSSTLLATSPSHRVRDKCQDENDGSRADKSRAGDDAGVVNGVSFWLHSGSVHASLRVGESGLSYSVLAFPAGVMATRSGTSSLSRLSVMIPRNGRRWCCRLQTVERDPCLKPSVLSTRASTRTTPRR
ncbi:uncharacterized protein K489DRAFT_259749 [Dissoconium aciculare CBS 342.82]|jgi:hypothetical protein|uniref:Secreted protein n=1 Tax=Dissoconium aciculare CBS 342.82 TaxID=1314786 RepID=A0A6J3LZ11_9PEZI|nr:uncharacterized protein K489DRAFT_259749 [Dissoconium aciculare CBS 342.82]KAF1820888.1 hypothetical protein K489DRAFT_259749 [Dissoconium aciculare CBS 342.82]